MNSNCAETNVDKALGIIKELEGEIEALTSSKKELEVMYEKAMEDKKELKETVRELAALIQLNISEKRESKQEEETRRKLEAIHKGIAEAIDAYSTRIRAAIETAREWGDDHNVMGRGEMLGIIERALPRLR
jgi:peptidoglycan hydrolase CwlO-like protein